MYFLFSVSEKDYEAVWNMYKSKPNWEGEYKENKIYPQLSCESIGGYELMFWVWKFSLSHVIQKQVQ